MAVSKRTRYEVLRRDNHTCRYCGAAAPDVKLTVDHVVPVALGGSNDPTNLVAACRDCNAGKSSTSPDERAVANVAEDAARWAAAKQAALDAMRAEQSKVSRDVARFLRAWKQWDKETDFLPNDWRTSITRWLEAGLTADQIIDALDIALTGPANSRHVFRYMAGVIYNWIRDIETRAQAIVRES